MDRTKNLPDNNGGYSHPPDDAALPNGAKIVDREPALNTAWEASSDSIESLEPTIGPKPAADGKRPSPDSIHGVSSFAIDPYVAQPTATAGNQTDPPKPIHEILKTLNGYQVEADRPETLFGSSRSSQSRIQPNRSKARTETPPTHELPDNPLALGGMEIENQIEAELKHASTARLAAVCKQAPPTKTAEIGPMVHRVSETLEGMENSLSASMGEWDQTKFGNHVFGDAEETPTTAPDPIRNAFDHDPDYFDYSPAEVRRDRRLNVESPVLRGPQLRRNCDGRGTTSPSSRLPSTSKPSMSTVENPDCFWVSDGELISIDGNDGFGCIDLTCFELSAASFQASRIEIQCDDGVSFQIEYCNVSHALFANGIEVELATKTSTTRPD
jgi:hypothetical protein